MGRRRPLLAALALAALVGAAAGEPPPQDASDAFFKAGGAVRLRIEIAPEEYAKLEKDPRSFVRATVREGDKVVYEGAGVKLKGAVGSFRGLEDKPAFTVRFDKFGGDAPFHGLEKIYLNNSVQDDTYLRELVGSEAFRAAGLPAPRISHARVALNERDLGLYVLKEGYDKRFLKRNFEDASGNLYDGGFCQDIDAPLERDEGKGPDDKADLLDLVAACRETDPLRRRAAIQRRLDVDAFLTYMAVERMLGHWDGYCLNKNNYRVYAEGKSGLVHFLPHGMDQVLQDADAPILDAPSAIVAAAVLDDAEWRAQFRKRITDLLPVFAPERLGKRMEEAASRLRSALGAAGAGPQGAAGLKDMIADRAKSLAEQAKSPEPKPLALRKGKPVALRNWRPVPESGAVKLGQTTIGSVRALEIDCVREGPAVASWRTKARLAPGRYRLEANVLTKDFEPWGEGAPGGVRLRTAADPKGALLPAAPSWKPLEYEFEVVAQVTDVELLLEMRGRKGAAYFRLQSLRLSIAD